MNIVLQTKGPLFLRALSTLPNNKKEELRGKCRQISALILKKHYDIYSVAQIHQSFYNTIGCLSLGLFELCGQKEDLEKASNILNTTDIEKIFKSGFGHILIISECRSDNDTKWMEYLGFDVKEYEDAINLSVAKTTAFVLELFSGEPEKDWYGIKYFLEQKEFCKKYSFLRWFYKKFFYKEIIPFLPVQMKESPITLYDTIFKTAIMNLCFSSISDFKCTIGRSVPNEIMKSNIQSWKDKIKFLKSQIPTEHQTAYVCECKNIYQTYISKGKNPKWLVYSKIINNCERALRTRKGIVTPNDIPKRRKRNIGRKKVS